MINKKKLGAFVLAGTMLLSMGTTVFAAGEPTVPDVNIALKKNTAHS